MGRVQNNNVIDLVGSIGSRAHTAPTRSVHAGRFVDPTAGDDPSLERVLKALETVVENIEYGVYFMGPDYRARMLNGAFRRMWDIDDEFADTRPDFIEMIEYLRERGMYAVTDDEWPAYVKARAEAVRSADGIQRESRRADGRVFLYKCLPLPSGGRMLTYFDITDQKRVEAELEASSQALEERINELELLRIQLRTQRDAAIRSAKEIKESRELLSEAIENANEAILVWDKDGKLIVCNRRILNIFPDMADIFAPGLAFEDMIRTSLRRGITQLSPGKTEDETVEERRTQHLAGRNANERQMGDGRWLRVQWRTTRAGKRVSTITDITQDKESEASILALASRDALTGLPNRRAFDDTLARLTKRWSAHQGANPEGSGGDEGDSGDEGTATPAAAPVGLLFIDLDDFKDVNDTFGHPAGDAVLKAVADRLSSCIRKSDIAARIGGDEFAVIVADVADQAPLQRLADRIIGAMTDPVTVEEVAIPASLSIGGAHCVTDKCGIDALTVLADRALYAAKQAGRNTSYLYSDL